MYIINRTLRFTRGFLLSYGPSPVKKLFWDREFSNGKWNFLDNTVGDCVYSHLNRFAQNKSVLDLGCGPGNTANEMAPGYRKYVGVDISEEALAKGRRRSEQNGRAGKNSFERGDFIGYIPSDNFDVILFREAMYHVPLGKVKKTLDRLSEYLTGDGVFIVRLYVSENGKTKYRPSAMIGIMDREFDVVEKSHYVVKTKSPETGSTVIVFRPKRRSLGANSDADARRS
jgi:SAM-dependent methyltransferase